MDFGATSRDGCGHMRIFFSAGEPSGDLHGANLIRELRQRNPAIEAVGYGGPVMAAAGCQLHEDLTALAVMWFLRVLLNIHKFLNLVSRADRYFRHHQVDAVVLIDYPGFNWWIAWRAKAHGIPVFYFAPPQLWAWAGWRIKKMRRDVDHVLCSLPFEAKWYAEQGCRSTFVGHPYFDEVRRQQIDPAFIERYRDEAAPLVAILPGSRTQEVSHNLKHFIAAARLIHAQLPQARFAIASFKPQQAAMARKLIEGSDLPIAVFVRRTPELIQLADCCMAVSGSVSLELLYRTKPTVVLYWISPIAYRVQAWFRKVKYITLVNLLTSDELFPKDLKPYDPQGPEFEKVLFPEYLTCQDKSQQIAEHIVNWLIDRDARSRLVARLAALKEEVAHGGASATAATYILDVLGRRPVRVPQPHFVPGRTLLDWQVRPVQPRKAA